jgi:hypothetical protein
MIDGGSSFFYAIELVPDLLQPLTRALTELERSYSNGVLNLAHSNSAKITTAQPSSSVHDLALAHSSSL